MLLAFDVGNTNIVMGVFRDGNLLTNWRLATDIAKSADEYGMLMEQLFRHEGMNMADVDDVIISTVVPSLLFTLQHMVTKYFGRTALVVESGVKTGLLIKYSDPKQIGADRIVNAVAAYSKYGGPVIIVDFSTATTFCAVSDKGEYLGGTIAPGLKISSDALFERTAKLPRVEIENPGMTICKNTAEAMQSGLVYGHVGMCEKIIKMMKEELAEVSSAGSEIKVVATGGFAGLIKSETDAIDYADRLLTLEGLNLIYEKNKNR